jgi:microcystin-dependent protein
MATVTKGRTFTSGETVTPAKLNDVVDLATVTNIQTADIADEQVTLAKLVTAVQESLLPAGAVQAFAMNNAPSGWLAADGTEYAKTGTYAGLFAAISTTYGETNGSGGAGTSHFRVPDLRGYFVRGSGTNSDGTAAGTFGEKQDDAFQGHWHNWHWSNGGRGTQAPSEFVDIISVNSPNSGPRGNRVQNAINDGANGAPRTANETRPKNIPMLHCIKF